MFSKNYIVDNQHLASHVGSGELNILSTPSLLAFIENTCMLKINENITSDQTSLGVKVELKHLKPSLENQEVECYIQNVTNQDNKWLFDIEVKSKDKLIAVCQHTRYIVNKKEFKNKINLDDNDKF